MRTERRNNGVADYDVLVADNGKVIRRKGTDDVFGEEFALGYSWYINGVKQDVPHKDSADDFEEIDAPEGYYDEIIDDYD